MSHTPLELDVFLPWMCAQMELIEEIYILKKYTTMLNTKSETSMSTRSIRFTSVKDMYLNNQSVSESHHKLSQLKLISTNQPTNTIYITLYYDSSKSKMDIIEIAIEGKGVNIPPKLIEIIKSCLPFHPLLTKFSIKGNVASSVLNRTKKMLQTTANIRDIKIQDCYIPECNFYILLDEMIQLKYLSLINCKVNDDVCGELTKRLCFGGPAEKSLQIFDLSRNFITDTGANMLAVVLRTNRSLLHLNLAANKITDKGGIAILSNLQEFILSKDELIELKKRRFLYYEKRLPVFLKCYEDVLQRINLEEHKNLKKGVRDTFLIKIRRMKQDDISNRTKRILKERSNSININTEQVKREADDMTDKLFEEFDDPFDFKSIVKKNDQTYATGNFNLSSLNVSFNNLSDIFLRTLSAVLNYQTYITKPKKYKGLIRVVVVGNSFIKTEYLDIIDMQLKEARSARRNPLSDIKIKRNSHSKK